MSNTVEISSFDLRYEAYRMKNSHIERGLLVSISEVGIREHLEGIDTNNARILLNGFKRLRCALKLGISIVPYVSLGKDEAMGIIQLVRVSNSKTLNILEQAKLVNELKRRHRMNISEIANLLSVSKSWVSMRIGLISQISAAIEKIIFSGNFPAYSYMYTLRQFMRMNYVKKSEIDEFVKLTAGKNLSIRNIELLAYGYFNGPPDFREQLRKGNIVWGLEHMKQVPIESGACNDIERSMLRDLEIAAKYIQRIMCKIDSNKFINKSFYAQANLIAAGILSKMPIFSRRLEVFYDRTGQA
ncbi:MAG: hypothetical protein JSW62_04435 [Thermoplasmatales archaeon]|nr:MAG: hypothetical protein JSW62_04435 [Thermoplasmatales archaeon]